MVIFIDTDKMMCSGLRKYYEHLHVMYKTIYTVMRQDHYDDIGKIGNQSEKKYIYESYKIFTANTFLLLYFILLSQG